MAPLPLKDAISRYKLNEDRADIFTNGADNQTWTTRDGRTKPSLSKFLKDMDDFVNNETDSILAQVGAARDEVAQDLQTTITARDETVAAKNETQDIADNIGAEVVNIRNSILARDICDLRDFSGYDLSGNNDSTSAIQAFVNQHYTSGFGRIPAGVLRAGQINIANQNANIEGAGSRATTIKPASNAISKQINVTGAKASLRGLAFESVNFNSGLTQIGNACIHLGAAAAKLTELEIYGYKRGVSAPTGGQHKVDRLRFWKCQEYGIVVGGAGEKVGDCHWTNLIFEGGPDGNPDADPYTYKGTAMAMYSGANAQYVKEIQITTYEYGVVIDDNQSLGGTFVPEYLWLDMLNSNAPLRSGLLVKKGNAIILREPTLCSWQESAAKVESVSSMRVYGGSAARSGTLGWEIYGGEVRFKDHDIGSNSRLNPNTYDGLLVTNAAEVHVDGGKIGNNLNNLGETQRNGIVVPNGFTGKLYVSETTDLRNNATAPVALGTGGTKVVKSRLGYTAENHGMTADTTMSSADVVIPHGLSGVPTWVDVVVIPPVSGSPAVHRRAVIKSVDATSIVVNVSDGAAFVTSGTFRFSWKAEL